MEHQNVQQSKRELWSTVDVGRERGQKLCLRTITRDRAPSIIPHGRVLTPRMWAKLAPRDQLVASSFVLLVHNTKSKDATTEIPMHTSAFPFHRLPTTRRSQLTLPPRSIRRLEIGLDISERT